VPYDQRRLCAVQESSEQRGIDAQSLYYYWDADLDKAVQTNVVLEGKTIRSEPVSRKKDTKT